MSNKKTTGATGWIKSVAVVLSIVMFCVVLLTGCTDDVAQQQAAQAEKEAYTAQTAADKASQEAKNAQNAAEAAAAAAQAAKDIADSKITEAQAVNALKELIMECTGVDSEADMIDTSGNYKEFIATMENIDKMLTGNETVKAYMTANSITDLNGLLASFANIDNIDEFLAQNDVIKAYMTANNVTDLTGLLASFATVGNLDEFLIRNDVIKAYMDANGITDLAGLLAAMTTSANIDTMLAQNTVIKAYMTTNGITDINGLLASLVRADNIDETLINNDIIKAFMQANGLTTLEGLLNYLSINDSAAHISEFDAATDEVIVQLRRLNAKEKQLEADRALYDDAVLDANPDGAFDKIWVAGERIRRAQTATAAKALGDAIIEYVNGIPTIADSLYAALTAVQSPVYFHINGVEEPYDSKGQIDACVALRAQAVTKLTALGLYDANIKQYTLADGVSVVDLDAKVLALNSEYYTVYATAYTQSAAIQTMIDALATYTFDTDFATTITNYTNAYNAANSAYATWVQTNFVDTSAPSGNANINIARMIDKTDLDAAPDMLTALNNAQTQAGVFNNRIVALLKNINYLSGDAEPYTVNGTCRYDTLDDITALKTEIDDFAADFNLTTADTRNNITNYVNLENALAYATRMTAKYNEAAAEGGLIDELAAVLELPQTLAIKTRVATLRSNLDSWTSIGNPDEVDADNIDYIIGNTTITRFAAVEARMTELTNAQNAAVAINTEIDSLTNIGVWSRSAVETARANANNWLTLYNIAVVGADDALAANYDLIKHAKLEAVEAEFTQVLVDAADDGQVVLDDINDFITMTNNLTEFKRSYKEELDRITAAYNAWATEYSVVRTDYDRTDIESAITFMNYTNGTLFKIEDANAKYVVFDNSIRTQTTTTETAINAMIAATVLDDERTTHAYSDLLNAATTELNTLRAMDDNNNGYLTDALVASIDTATLNLNKFYPMGTTEVKLKEYKDRYDADAHYNTSFTDADGNTKDSLKDQFDAAYADTVARFNAVTINDYKSNQSVFTEIAAAFIANIETIAQANAATPISA